MKQRTGFLRSHSCQRQRYVRQRFLALLTLLFVFAYASSLLVFSASASSSSQAAATLIEQREGFQPVAKYDVNAYRAGYGSDTVTDPNTGAVSSVYQGEQVTQAQANADLSRRLGNFQNTVENQVGQSTWDSLNSDQQAALTSNAYNYGSLQPSVVAAVKSGDQNAVSQALINQETQNGGVNADRRAQEAQLYTGQQSIANGTLLKNNQSLAKQNGQPYNSTPAKQQNQTNNPATAKTQSQPNQTTTQQQSGQQNASSQNLQSQTNSTINSTGTSNQSAPNPTITMSVPTQQQLSAVGSQTMGIGDPTICWVCNAGMYTLGAVELMASTAGPVIAQDLWPILVPLAGLALMIGICKAILIGQSPWPEAIRFSVRFIIVGAIFAGGTIAAMPTGDGSAPNILNAQVTDSGDGLGGSNSQVSSGGSQGGSLIFDYVLGPPIEAGSAMGLDLANTAASALGIQMTTTNCTYDTASTAGVSKLQSVSDPLMKLLCEVHIAGVTGIQLGAIIAVNTGQDATILDKVTEGVLVALGAAIMYFCMMAMVNFGFALMECMIKVGVVATFLPLLMFAWLFETTRGMAKNILDSMLFSFLYFVLSGLGSVISVFILMKALSFGVNGGSSSGSIDAASLVSQFNNIVSAGNLASTSLGNVAQLIGFGLAGALLAGRVLLACQDMASDISGFVMGRRGEAAQVGMTIVNRTVSAGMAVGGLAAGLGIRGLASAGGAAAGRAMGAMRR